MTERWPEHLAPAVRDRIQAVADRIGAEIIVVGSRASGTAGPNSDWDYLIGATHSSRRLAARLLPRGPGGGRTGHRGETGIDIFNANLEPLRSDLPHIVFQPVGRP